MPDYKKGFMDNPYAKRWIDLGGRSDAPFRILAPLIERSKAATDGVVQAATEMARRFQYSEIHFVINPKQHDADSIKSTSLADITIHHVEDGSAGYEALGHMLTSDYDFIFPADSNADPADSDRWSSWSGLSPDGTGPFDWPPQNWSRRGTRPEKPFRLFTPARVISFGDYIGQIHASAKLAAKFQHSITTFFSPGDRKNNRFATRYFPYAYEDYWAVNKSAYYAGVSQKYSLSQDFVLPNDHASDKLFVNMGAGRLTVPDTFRSKADAALQRLGLAADRWFCCLHFRQPNYRYKQTSNCRDVDPEPYLNSIDYIIDELGGQVVLLGHPEMTTRPARPGFIDLSRLPDSSDLQMCAVARSRFFYCSPSGAACLALALHTPLGVIDQADFWNGGVLAYMSHTLVEPNGTRLDNEALYESGWMTTNRTGELLSSGAGFVLEKRSESDIRRMIDHMLNETKDVAAWRDYREREIGSEGKFSWPLSIGLNPNFI